MHYDFMSAEKIISTEVNDLPPSTTPKKSEEVLSSGRVDINDLLARVRKQKKKRRFFKFNFCRYVYCFNPGFRNNFIFLKKTF